MALPMLVNNSECGPSNPLQGLSKRFDQDRGIQQVRSIRDSTLTGSHRVGKDFFGAGRAGSSREVNFTITILYRPVHYFCRRLSGRSSLQFLGLTKTRPDSSPLIRQPHNSQHHSIYLRFIGRCLLPMRQYLNKANKHGLQTFCNSCQCNRPALHHKCL
jgi:hypothetical protein